MVFPPFSLVGPKFIVPNPLEIIVNKYPGRNLVITDVNHTILLKVKPNDTTFHCQLMLLDAHDNPIALLRQKTMSAHSTWNVFKGESKNESDLIFSTRTDHVLFNYKLNLNMTLANKTRSNGSCDMRIKGDWAKGKVTIYMGNSSTAIAQMHKPQNVKYVKDKFTVTIQPNMDYAGVVALFAIADAFEHPEEVKKGSGTGAAGVAFDVLNAVGSLGNS
ncbi:protein LURP-one-related 10-like [Bidens hawaiensis]|uniref:protein LURP-one-related 10-like n=1 Tax=Bidens hawaiensis TaxID=980011 RepID=UPI00404A55CB